MEARLITSDDEINVTTFDALKPFNNPINSAENDPTIQMIDNDLISIDNNQLSVLPSTSAQADLDKDNDKQSESSKSPTAKNSLTKSASHSSDLDKKMKKKRILVIMNRLNFIMLQFVVPLFLLVCKFISFYFK